MIGCAGIFIKVSYNNFDKIIIERLDHYFNLGPDQERYLGEKIKRLHGIHRKIEMPLYAKTLKTIGEKAGRGLNREDVPLIFREMEKAGKRLYELFLPEAAVFLSTLEDEQIDYFEERLKESNDRIAEDLKKPPEERLNERYERSLGFYENIYGSLSREQMDRLKTLNRDLPDIHMLKLEYSRKIQDEFISFIRSKPQKPVIENRLREWFITRQYSSMPEYGRILRDWRMAALELHLQIEGTLTGTQKNHASGKINNWIEIIDELIAGEWLF